MVDKKDLAEYSSEYLANALIDCRYLLDRFDGHLKTHRERIQVLEERLAEGAAAQKEKDAQLLDSLSMDQAARAIRESE